MENFIKALKSRQGFAYLNNYRQHSDLTRDQMRGIAKELIYAIERVGLLESEITEIYEIVEENLKEQYVYEM